MEDFLGYLNELIHKSFMHCREIGEINTEHWKSSTRTMELWLLGNNLPSVNILCNWVSKQRLFCFIGAPYVKAIC